MIYSICITCGSLWPTSARCNKKWIEIWSWNETNYKSIQITIQQFYIEFLTKTFVYTSFLRSMADCNNLWIRTTGNFRGYSQEIKDVYCVKTYKDVACFQNEWWFQDVKKLFKSKNNPYRTQICSCTQPKLARLGSPKCGIFRATELIDVKFENFKIHWFFRWN